MQSRVPCLANDVLMTNLRNISKYPYSGHSEFLQKREELSGKGQKDLFRLGASEIGAVLGLSDWKSPTVFFYEACEFVPKPKIMTLDMHRGIIQEPIIYSEYWRFINPNDPSSDSYLQNYHGERKIYRTATKSDAIYINQDYPWLFASPDYNVDDDKGLLDCKSNKKFIADKYESGISQEYVVQGQDQLICTGRSYVDFLCVLDATEPRLFTFERNQDLIDYILSDTKKFVDLVLEGKKIVYSDLSYEEKEIELAIIAPEDEGTLSYHKFLKDKHKPENALLEVDGSQEQLDIVVQFLTMKEQFEKPLLKLDNNIREMFPSGVGTINFGEDVGKISWKEKLNVPKGILKKINA
jgi:predicted phage-related endonuclease